MRYPAMGLNRTSTIAWHEWTPGHAKLKCVAAEARDPRQLNDRHNAVSTNHGFSKLACT